MANVLVGGGAEETGLVHRWRRKARGEEQSEGASGARGGLDDVVFFGAKVTAAEIARHGSQVGSENGEAKEGCAKGPPGLIEFGTSRRGRSKIEYEGRTLSPR